MLRTRSIALATAAAAVASIVLMPSTAQAAGSVHLYKIYYDSPGTDRGANSSLNAEWVQVRNTTGAAVNLRGWTLRDAAGHVYTFGAYTLAKGATVTVRTGKGTNTSTNRYWGRTWYVWNNDKDAATLKRANGTVADTCSYNSTAYDYKLC